MADEDGDFVKGRVVIEKQPTLRRPPISLLRTLPLSGSAFVN